MSKFDLLNTVSRSTNKLLFNAKKYSPELLIGAGAVGIVFSTIMACKATIKLDAVMEEHKERISSIKEAVESKEYKDVYTPEDSKKDMAVVYIQTGVKVARLYAPAITVGVLSLACIIGSHTILNRRNLALTAAYATLDQTFKDYRTRVVERFGEEVDKDLRYNIKSEEIEETVVDENGKEKTVKKTGRVTDAVLDNDYARYFDSSNPLWQNSDDYNRMYIQSQQRYANDRLKARGYVFLNEVYELLGMPSTKAGQIVGWVYKPASDEVGDGYIDFGMTPIDKDNGYGGYENAYILNFNVDGNVWENM